MLSIIIIWIHFLVDFVLQPDKMREMKCKSYKWLALHSVLYGCAFLFLAWEYAVINMVLHFVVDGVTIKIDHWFVEREKRYFSFVLKGFDQALHITILYVSLMFFLV